MLQRCRLSRERACPVGCGRGQALGWKLKVAEGGLTKWLGEEISLLQRRGDVDGRENALLVLLNDSRVRASEVSVACIHVRDVRVDEQ